MELNDFRIRLYDLLIKTITGGCYKLDITHGLYNKKVKLISSGESTYFENEIQPSDEELINQIAIMANMDASEDAPRVQEGKITNLIRSGCDNALFKPDITLEKGSTFAELKISLTKGIISDKCTVEIVRINVPNPNEKTIAELKAKYTPGTRVELLHDMFDTYDKTMTMGCKGTVRVVDDLGSIHVDWDKGGSLALLYPLDKFEVVEDEKHE